MQLGRLLRDLELIRNAGVEVLAISNDDRERASRMAAELQHRVTVLSDPTMRVIYRYGMKGRDMPMADMGYVLIDRAGTVLVRKIDRQFGEHIAEILPMLGGAVRATAAP